MQIRAVLFDLGETLLNFGRVDSMKAFREAGELSYSFLRSLGQNAGGFQNYLWRNLIGLRLRHFFSRISGKDFDSLAVLKKYGEKRGFKLSEEQWEELNWLWYEPLSRLAKVEPDLRQTLDKLKALGLKLGIVSNTFVHGSSLDRHLLQEGLLDLFEFQMYSYEYSFRKPDKRIFLAAADRIGHEPDNIVFVGDRIDNDIKGALSAGMHAVMKRAYTNVGKRSPDNVVSIENISELVPIVDRINNGQ